METIQQPKIIGYRPLSTAEAALMNQIKAKGLELQELVLRVQDHLVAQRQVATSCDDQETLARVMAAEPGRWVSISRTHFQEGLMALTRSVAQPGSF